MQPKCISGERPNQVKMLLQYTLYINLLYISNQIYTENAWIFFFFNCFIIVYKVIKLESLFSPVTWLLASVYITLKVWFCSFFSSCSPAFLKAIKFQFHDVLLLFFTLVFSRINSPQGESFNWFFSVIKDNRPISWAVFCAP